MTKLIVYNTEYGAGLLGHSLEYLKFWRILAPNKLQNTKIAEALKKYNPDILGLVEIDLGSARFNHIDQTKVFAKQLSLKYTAAHIKYANKSLLWNTIPILRKQGNAILSKHPIKAKYNEFNNSMKRCIIDCSITVNKKIIRVLLVHLPLNFKARQKQFIQLIDILNQIKEPTILMGDFNTFKGKHEIKELLETTQLTYKYTAGKHTKHNTQPTYKPNKILDYVLTSKEINVSNYEVLQIKLSDHLPVMVDFTV